ncbi:MAG: copper resistance protein CopC, partial [Gemmatimonadota bacterium]
RLGSLLPARGRPLPVCRAEVGAVGRGNDLRTVRTALIVAGVLAVSATAGVAAMPVHARLVASTPAAGDTLRALPTEMRLLFSEPVEAGLIRIRVVAQDGSAIDLAPRPDPGDVRTVLADFPSIGAGGYRVIWRVVSADGHPIQGDFVFFVAEVEPLRPEPAHPEPVRLEVPPPASIETGWRPSPLLNAAVEALALGALLALAGILLHLPPAGREIPRVARALALAAPLLLAVHGGLWALALSPEGSLSAALADALGTTAGRVELARLGLAGLAAWALVLARRPRLAVGLAFAAVLAGGALGHALARSPGWSIPAKAIHLAAAAVWLGGLLRLATIDATSDLFPATARRVSGAALVSVIVIGATGVLQAALILPTLTDLVSSDYGRFVLAKAAGLATLIGMGAYHRRRLMPRLDAGSGEALRRSVRREIVMFAVVLLIAARLAYVPPPETVLALILEGAR